MSCVVNESRAATIRAALVASGAFSTERRNARAASRMSM
jgi:hypothetical protein